MGYPKGNPLGKKANYCLPKTLDRCLEENTDYVTLVKVFGKFAFLHHHKVVIAAHRAAAALEVL